MRRGRRATAASRPYHPEVRESKKRSHDSKDVIFNSEERSVRKYARDTLSAKVKFITSDSALDYTGEFNDLILLVYLFSDRFCLCHPSATTKKQRFLIGQMCIVYVVCKAEHLDANRWDEFHDFVRKEIRQRRTNCNTSLKMEYIGKTNKQSSLLIHDLIQCFFQSRFKV
jgi:hypothetical protein